MTSVTGTSAQAEEEPEHPDYPKSPSFRALPDEIAVRLHHRLTQIHGFPNGNGRHARMMADLRIEKLGGVAFTWGSGTLHETGALRAAYIAAVKAANKHDFGPLMKFVRS